MVASSGRLAKYIRELLEDNRKDFNIRKRNFAALPIMKGEIKEAIRKMKLGKAIGPNSISVELLGAFEGYGNNKTTTILSEIYDTGHIPENISKSIIITH